MNKIELNSIEEKQISKFTRLVDVLITIFSKPSGMIGFSIVISVGVLQVYLDSKVRPSSIA